MAFSWTNPTPLFITLQEINDCKNAINTLKIKADQGAISWSAIGIFINSSIFDEIRSKILDIETSLKQSDDSLCSSYYSTHKSVYEATHHTTYKNVHYTTHLATHNSTYQATHYGTYNSSTNTSVLSSHYSSHNGSNYSTRCSSHYSSYNSGLCSTHRATHYSSHVNIAHTNYYITNYLTNDASHYYQAKTTHNSANYTARYTGNN